MIQFVVTQLFHCKSASSYLIDLRDRDKCFRIDLLNRLFYRIQLSAVDNT